MFSNSIIRHINLYYLLIDKLNILNSFIVHFIAYPTFFNGRIHFPMPIIYHDHQTGKTKTNKSITKLILGLILMNCSLLCIYCLSDFF